VVMTGEDEVLDLMSLVERADLGRGADLPAPTATRNFEPWADAEAAGVPQRLAPPQPWTPRVPATPEPAHARGSETPVALSTQQAER
jgi:hypothetical protein